MDRKPHAFSGGCRPRNRLGEWPVSAYESERRPARSVIGKTRVSRGAKSMPQSGEVGPIRLTSLETGFYTEHGLGVHERSRCARNRAWFTEKGTGAHEGVREEGQP